MPPEILVLDEDASTRHWLKSILERENYVVRTAERGAAAQEQIARARPDLLVMDVVLSDIDGLEFLRRLRRDPSLRDLRVIVLSLKASPDDMIAGLAAGADDYIAKRPGANVDLTSKVRVLLSFPRSGGPTLRGTGGEVFAFCSAKGGTGTTSVCINTAYALTQLEPDAKVLVVDLVLPIGTMGAAVGYETDRTISQLTQEVQGRIERGLVEKYVSPPTRWGFHVLLAAQNPQEASHLEAGQIVPLFNTLRSMYDYVFADFGRALSRVSLPVMQTAQRIILILGSDVNNVKLSKALLDYFQGIGISRNRLLLISNRTVGRVRISKEEIEQQLGLALAGTIPFESEHMSLAINAGVPFAAKFPEQAASVAFTDVARLLLDRKQS